MKHALLLCAAPLSMFFCPAYALAQDAGVGDSLQADVMPRAVNVFVDDIAALDAQEASEELVDIFVFADRIANYDDSGPELNAVIVYDAGGALAAAAF